MSASVALPMLRLSQRSVASALTASPLASTSRLILPSQPRRVTPSQFNIGKALPASSSPFASNSQPLHQRYYSATPNRQQLPTSSHHFDTHALVTRLESSGMPRAQADALVAALDDVVSESLRQLEKGCVGREEGEKWRYAQKVDFARLKSEIQLLERNDFAMMKTENERLMADVEKLKQRLREEVTRTTAGVRLDLNLEKGRIRDESSVHALKIKEVDTRIESEIAGLRTSIQSAKFNVL